MCIPSYLLHGSIVLKPNQIGCKVIILLDIKHYEQPKIHDNNANILIGILVLYTTATRIANHEDRR